MLTSVAAESQRDRKDSRDEQIPCYRNEGGCAHQHKRRNESTRKSGSG